MSREIAGNIKINSYADLIGGELNEVSEIEIAELHEFKGHPFKVLDDEKMQVMVESIKAHGVLVPGVVRAIPEGGYEIISGHRRKRACELAGLPTMPVLIKKYNDNEAVIAMIDSNLQREEILPSEKAFAYKMKLEALTHQGKTADADVAETTSRQVGEKLNSVDLVGLNMGESARQVHRYIRLTELLPDLLDMVDDRKLKFNPAVELSYLTDKQQEILIKVMTEDDAVPTLAQALQLKKLSREQSYTKESVHAIMSVSIEKEKKISINPDIIKRFFAPETSEKEIENIILKLLEKWKKNGGKT